MPLTQKQKRQLRRLAHARKPVVTVGRHGLTPAVLAEIDSALTIHELLKIKLPETDGNSRHTLALSISSQSQAEIIQMVGRILTIYRANKEPTINIQT